MKVFLTVLLFSSLCFATDQAPPEVIAAMPEEAPIVQTITEAPSWLVTTLETVSSLPVVGPIIVEIAKWLGVLASIATILVTALMAILRALQVVLPAVKLASLVNWVIAIENSKALYWLKFFSMYNAKKKEPDAEKAA